jgi:hypothetical protein
MYAFFLLTPLMCACSSILVNACSSFYFNISKRVFFFERREIQGNGHESCRLLGCDAVLSSINLLTFQSKLLPATVRSLYCPEDGCSSFPKGR